MKTLDPQKRLNSYLRNGPVEDLIQDLATKSGVSRATIYNIRAGQDVRLSTWRKLEPHLKRQRKAEKSPDRRSPPPPDCASCPQDRRKVGAA